MPTKIRKSLIAEFGDVSKITVVDAEIEDPSDRHVQVKVIYSGFAGADINMRLGRYPLQRKAPLTPGYCMVGKVYQNGPQSTKFTAGDTVTCLTVYDAQAELINVPEKYLIKVPSGLDLQTCCALILDWNTAYGMVHRAAKVASGQRVFIHGLSGAVGNALMALCQLQGAEVYGTASERNHAALRELGATPFTYTNKDWIEKMRKIGGVHAVFDALGFESWDESYSILSAAERGILIGYGGNLHSFDGNSPQQSVIGPTVKLLARNYLVFWSRKRTNFYYIDRDQSTFVPELNALFELSREGKLPVKIKHVFDLEDIQEAHKSWGKIAGMGSLLIRVSKED